LVGFAGSLYAPDPRSTSRRSRPGDENRTPAWCRFPPGAASAS